MNCTARPVTLAIDIGGTGVKATLIDPRGRMCAARKVVPTPYPCRPRMLLDAIAGLATKLPGYDRISVGVPGVVRDGQVVTAPHFGTEFWRGRPFAGDLRRRLGKPARLLNDAEVQGLGIIKGRGLEVVLTLGTGVGSAVFSDGRLAPHLELAHHPIQGHQTYNQYAGDAARKAVGTKRWNRRVLRMIAVVEILLNYDMLYLGGGNAAQIQVPLPENVQLASNDAGLTGGSRLWDDRMWNAVPVGRAARGGRLP